MEDEVTSRTGFPVSHWSSRGLAGEQTRGQVPAALSVQGPVLFSASQRAVPQQDGWLGQRASGHLYLRADSGRPGLECQKPREGLWG